MSLCECPTQEAALAKKCTRGGVPMVGRMYQMCSGRCLTEEPKCQDWQRNMLLAKLDGKPVPPRPTGAPGSSLQPGQMKIEVMEDGKDKVTILLPDGKPPPAAAPATGPGLNLKVLIDDLDLGAFGGCGCDNMVEQMNLWGVEGCRKPEHRAAILEQLHRSQAEAEKRGGVQWQSKIAFAMKHKALATRMLVEDPAEVLLDEAIRLAAAPG